MLELIHRLATSMVEPQPVHLIHPLTEPQDPHENTLTGPTEQEGGAERL